MMNPFLQLHQDAVLWKAQQLWLKATNPDAIVDANASIAEMLLCIPETIKRDRYIKHISDFINSSIKITNNELRDREKELTALEKELSALEKKKRPTEDDSARLQDLPDLIKEKREVADTIRSAGLSEIDAKELQRTIKDELDRRDRETKRKQIAAQTQKNNITLETLGLWNDFDGEVESAYEFGIAVYRGRYYSRGKNDDWIEISNFTMKIIYHVNTGNDVAYRLISVKNIDGTEKTLNINTDDFVSVGPFKKVLARQGHFVFKGTDNDLSRLHELLQKDEKPTDLITVLGYHPRGRFYSWANGITDVSEENTLRKQLGLTALSQKDLVAELRRLHALKNIATPQTKEFFELQKQIDAVSARLKNVRAGTFGFKAALGSIKDEVKQFGVLAASYLGFEFLTDQTRNLINAQAKMADENADIAKTTSLTTKEIKDLSKEIRGLDTRTSNSRLRQLGAEAGKLGKDGVEDLKRFIKEANIMEVALGEDLGEGGLIKVAKAANILKESMTGLASGINAVGANSAASEAYQVDFTFRLAGTAQAARLAAGDVLGMAAALELNGQTAEVAVKNEKATLDQKNKALKDLIALSPQYLSGLNAQNVATAEGAKIIRDYTGALREKALEEARSNVRAQAFQKLIEAQLQEAKAVEVFNKLSPQERSLQKASYQSGKSNPLAKMIPWNDDLYTQIAEARKAMDDSKKTIAEIDKMSASAIEKAAKTSQNLAKETSATSKRTVADIRKDIQLLDEALDALDVKDGKAISANRAERAALERELNTIEGKRSKADRSVAAAENRLLGVQEKITQIRVEIEAMQSDMESGAKVHDEKEIASVVNKYQRLLSEAKKYAKEALADANNYEKEITELQQKELDILFAKQFDRRSEQEYEQSLTNLKVYYEKQANITRQQYLSGELTKRQYMLRLQELDRTEAEDRLTITRDYADTVLKASEDLEKARTAVLEKEAEKREFIEERSMQDKVFTAERALLTATPGSNAELKAQKDLLQAKFAQETAYMDLTSEEYLTHQAQLNRDLKDLDKSFWTAKLQFAMEQLQGVADIYSAYLDLQNQKDEAALEKDRNNNDLSKKFYQRQLDSKLISRATYDHHVNQLDDEMEAKERAYKKRAAKRARSAAIFNAILSTAQGVARAYADYAWPYNLIVSAIVGGLGAVQIAKASNTTEPVGRKGLIVPGPSHEDGGVDLVERKSGKTLANVEGGEPLWVFSKATYRNNKDVLDQLMYNSQNRNGARIIAARWQDA